MLNRPLARTTRRAVAGSLTALALTVSTAGCFPFGDDSRTVTAYFDDTAGLFLGNEVGVLGVEVGTVTDIEPAGDRVKVTMEVTDPDVKIPAGAGALVVARSVATDRYVELTPVFKDGDTEMADNAEIPLEKTRTPVEWDEILAAMDRFTKGLSGQDGNAGALSRLLKTGAKALDGTGTTANKALTDVAKATTALADHREDITGSIDDMATLTEVLAANGKTIDEFVTSVTTAAETFNGSKEDLGAALVSLSSALNQLAEFVRANRGELKEAIAGLTDVTNNVLAHEKSLGEAVETLPVAFDNLGRAVTKSGYVDVRLPLQDLSPLPDLTDTICAAIPANLCNALSLDAVASIGELLNILGGGL